ncbi:hypothetical protein [Spirosoma litoris]
MTDKQIYDLYVLQSKNVRRLKQVQKSIIKDINFYLRKNDSFQVEIKTKLLALLHCTLSEAEFIQIVHTPRGFNSTEISQIKAAKNNNIEAGWKTMIDLAMDKVGNWQMNDDLKTRRDYLHSIINEFIVNPSLLRNKIAHGQWEYALNRENTSQNEDLTTELSKLDVVTISKWLKIHQSLGLIIRDLIQSPKVGFHNNYWVNLTKMEQYILSSKKWNLNSKMQKLQVKPIKTGSVSDS